MKTAPGSGEVARTSMLLKSRSFKLLCGVGSSRLLRTAWKIYQIIMVPIGSFRLELDTDKATHNGCSHYVVIAQKSNK